MIYSKPHSYVLDKQMFATKTIIGSGESKNGNNF